MKQPIRFFSIGLLIASVIMLIVYIIDDPSTIQSDENDLNTDEMIQALEVEGFHVLSSSEYIKLSVGDDDTEQDDSSTDKNGKDKDKDKNNKDSSKKDDKDKDQSDDDSDRTDKGADNDDDSDANNDDSDEEDTVTYTLTVSENMLGPDVSELLYDNKIIDDAEKFNRYLEVEGYAPYIQLGDHKVSSDMSFEELAEKIANH